LPSELTSKGYKILANLCKAKIKITRSCSPLHACQVTCDEFLQLLQRTKKLPVCKAQVDRVLPCKHTVKVECHSLNQIPLPVCKQKVNMMYTYECGIHSLKIDVCNKYTDLVKMKPDCKELVTCNRFRCGHLVKLPCYAKKLAEQSLPGCRLSDWKEINKNGTN